MISILAALLLVLIAPLPYSVQGAPPLRKSPVTAALIVINTAIYVATHFGPSGALNAILSYDRYGVLPIELRPITLITYAFIHISVPHLLWNMLALYLAGIVVEQRLGHFVYLIIYLLGGVAGGLLYTFISLHDKADIAASFTPLAGASGAISCVMGLFLVYASSRAIQLYWGIGALIGKGWDQIELPAGLMVLCWLAQNVYGAVATLIGHGDGVAYFAHLGGFLFGTMFGYCAVRLVGPRKAARRAGRGDSGRSLSLRDEDAVNPMLALLERAVDEGDKEKAAALYAKCRTIGVSVPASMQANIERLGANL